MKLAILILVSMLTELGPHSVDTETEAERAVRMKTLATAMVRSSELLTCTGEHAGPECVKAFPGSKSEAVVGLFTIGRFESYFAQHIHEDRCRLDIGECDGGRAKSPFQLHAYSPLTKKMWQTIGGTDYESTQRASTAALIVLSRGKRCDAGTPEAMFRAYATSRCDGRLKDAKLRAAFYVKSLREYRRRWHAARAEEERALDGRK